MNTTRRRSGWNGSVRRRREGRSCSQSGRRGGRRRRGRRGGDARRAVGLGAQEDDGGPSRRARRRRRRRRRARTEVLAAERGGGRRARSGGGGGGVRARQGQAGVIRRSPRGGRSSEGESVEWQAALPKTREFLEKNQRRPDEPPTPAPAAALGDRRRADARVAVGDGGEGVLAERGEAASEVAGARASRAGAPVTPAHARGGRR